VLLQNRNDLLFRVSAFLHRSPPFQITGELQFSLAEFFGGRSATLWIFTPAFLACYRGIRSPNLGRKALAHFS